MNRSSLLGNSILLLLLLILPLSSSAFEKITDEGSMEILEATEENQCETQQPTDRYLFQIEMKKGYLSGIMLLRREGEKVMGNVVNEFGLSAMEFEYDLGTGKVKLHNVVAFLNKWYIKRVLKKDLKAILSSVYTPEGEKSLIPAGGLKIENKKRNLKYTLEEYETSK